MARDVVTALRAVLDVHYRLTYAIERVNRIVARSALASRFISLFYAEFEPSGNLVYCNAGHPPPLLLREGQVTALRRGGLVLGPDPGAVYERGFRNFQPGSTLLLYTDGITEAASNSDTQLDLQRLAALLVETDGESAEKIVDEVFRRVATLAPGAPEDDRTVLVVRRQCGDD
jgi:sigma-B regulation protein RsbU (phosphoserine phosphatase)